MKETMQTWKRLSASQPLATLSAGESLLGFVQEHFGSLAYANKVGWLYVAQADDRGSPVFKVGFSMKPENRVRELNNASPFRKSQLLAACPARLVDEMGFHKCMTRFQYDEARKEWYPPNPRIDALASYINTNGALPAEIIEMGNSVAADLVAKRIARTAKGKLGKYLTMIGNAHQLERLNGAGTDEQQQNPKQNQD